MFIKFTTVWYPNNIYFQRRLQRNVTFRYLQNFYFSTFQRKITWTSKHESNLPLTGTEIAEEIPIIMNGDDDYIEETDDSKESSSEFETNIDNEPIDVDETIHDNSDLDVDESNQAFKSNNAIVLFNEDEFDDNIPLAKFVTQNMITKPNKTKLKVKMIINGLL